MKALEGKERDKKWKGNVTLKVEKQNGESGNPVFNVKSITVKSIKVLFI